MLSPGAHLQNRYRIIRRIGLGGMGAVYEAEHEELSHTVALKETLHTEDESLRRAFKREARMLAGLRHPALPRVTDYFTEGDGLFLVMEFITGDDLMERLSQRKEPFPLDEVLRWADELLDVLEYLHTREPPIIHRDIKPNNIKLTERGNCILLDFGLAKGAIGEATSVLASRSVLGFTLTYAPLEQILKADPNLVEHLSVFGADKIEHALRAGTDARSDLYALGATLYHLLTKKQPAQSPTRALAIWSGRADPLLSASEVNPQVPALVSAVLEKALALDSEGRPASAAEMRKLLRDAMQPAQVKPTATVEPVAVEMPPTVISPQMDVLPTVRAVDTSPKVASRQTRSDQLAPTQTQPEQPTPTKTMVASPNLMPPAPMRQSVDRRGKRLFARPRVYIPLILVAGLALLLILKIIISVKRSPTLTSGGAQSSSSPSTRTDESVLTISGLETRARSIAFSPDGTMLAAGENRTIKLWDVASGRELRSLSAPFRANVNHGYSVAFSPDGSMLASGEWEDDDNGLKGYYHSVRLWDVASGRELLTLTNQSGVATGIAFSPDGRILASGDRKNVKLWDVQNGRQLRELTGLSGELSFVSSLAFSPDGKTLAGGTWNDAVLWDVSSGRQLHLLPTESSVTIAFSPDGKTLATGTDPGNPPLKLKLWDAASGTELAAFGEELESQLKNIALSPDGKMLASAYLIDSDGTSIVLWDVASRRVLRKLKGHSDLAVTSLAFSPDGTMLASSGSDKTIKLWRVKE